MKDILKTLGAMGIEAEGFDYKKNANEVMNTSGTGRGEEYVPDEVLAKEIFDAVPKYSTFLADLPGYHGANMDPVMNVPVIGDPGLMSLKAEKTTSAFSMAQGTVTDTITGETVVTQKKLFMSIDVSRELSDFNVTGAEAFEATIKEKIGKAWARTCEAAIVNGDTETGATGNVNSDDGAPTAGTYYLGFNGLRKESIVTQTNTVNVGTFAVADLLSVANELGDYFADPSQCLWLFNRATYNTALGLQAFYDASQRGQGSTLNGNALTNILGADLFVARDLPKTEADGKVSTTAANNTLGQFLCFWKPAVQWGYGGQLKLKLFDWGADGYQLQGWGYFGYGLASKKAGITDDMVCVGRNVTI